MTGICPHCGFDLANDAVIERDGFTIDPRGAVHFAGQRVPLSTREVHVLHTIAKADGRTLATATIMERVTESENLNIVSVWVLRIRQKLQAHGAPNPIRTAGKKMGSGYFWSITP